MNDYVLIVDDEPIIRNGLKNFINWDEQGLTLVGDCANGLEAFERLRSQPIDILITDIKMPVMDGLELTRKALEVNPLTKVILISSYNEFEYVREGMKQGAVDYLLKPSLEAGNSLLYSCDVKKCCSKTAGKSCKINSSMSNWFSLREDVLSRKSYACSQPASLNLN